MGFLASHKIKAILFDIDGTLYPKSYMNKYLFLASLSSPIFSLSYSKMRREIRLLDGSEVQPVLDLSAFREKEAKIIYKGKPNINLDSYKKHYDKAIKQKWIHLFKGIKPYEGMNRTLEEAKAKGYILGALSDFPLCGKLETLGVDSLCSFKASCEDYGYLKPNPVPFLEMLKALALKPEEAIYLGDSYSKDILGAKQVGMYTCYLTQKTKDFPLSDIVVKSWNEMYNKLF